MARSALNFARAHPVDSPGYAAALKRLEDAVARLETVSSEQRDGQLEERVASRLKQELRRQMKNGHLAHIISVAKVAAQEAPTLPGKLVYKPGSRTNEAFLTTARGMATEAEVHKDLLIKYGMVESVFDGLVEALNQFEAAMQRGIEGRRAHVAASAELEAVADEIIQLVHAMDGVNQLRFANDADLLAAWESASSVLITARSTPEQESTQQPPQGAGEHRAA
jgi:hypothetical protein